MIDFNLSPWQMFFDAIIMGVILFVVLCFVGQLVSFVNEHLGRLVVVLSLPAGAVFAVLAFVIMITG